MSDQKLAAYLKVAYPNFKKCSDLPPYLLPERSFDSVVDQLGDDGIYELGRPFQLEAGVHDYMANQQKYEAAPDKLCQEGCLSWPPMIVVKPVVDSVQDACYKIMSRYSSGELKADYAMACRTLAKLAFAPFVTQGGPVLKETGLILDIDQNNPAELIKRYSDAVVNNELTVVDRIDEALGKYPDWSIWVLSMQEKAQSFSSTPKIIAITPPLSVELTDVLAAMIKEARNAGA